MTGHIWVALGAWARGAFDREVPAWRRAARLAPVACALALLVARPAFAGIIEDAVRDGTQGMLDYVTDRVNSMADAVVPRSFDNLFDGGSASSHVYGKAVAMYSQGIVRSLATTLLGLAMLVRLAKIAERAEASATFPAVREVAALLAWCSVQTYLVGHAWDLMAALFSDLSGVWASWDADVPARVGRVALDASQAGLAAVLPLFVSTAICMLLADASVVVAKVVVWGRGMQLYFMAAMSPIPLALLAVEETRQMGIGFLRNFASLVLGYAALSFVLRLYPTLLATAVATSWQAGGADAMVLSISAACVLQVALAVRCGSWARDVLGG